MKRRRFVRHTGQNEEVNLQITSMADIFTILLVYLLKTFSTGISSITPSSAVILPWAHASDEIVETIKLEIAPHVIVIEDHPVVLLKSFAFDLNELDSSQYSKSLSSWFNKEKKQDTTPRLMILADQHTPYSTLRTVIDTATRSGFANFKLLVAEDQ